MSKPEHISWHCLGCVAAETLVTHWLTSTGCIHYDNGGGDNAASCWCGWNGPRVPNVGEAVRTWAEHAAEMLEAALKTAKTSKAEQLAVENSEPEPLTRENSAAGQEIVCTVGSCQRHGKCMYRNHPRCPLPSPDRNPKSGDAKQGSVEDEGRFLAPKPTPQGDIS